MIHSILPIETIMQPQTQPAAAPIRHIAIQNGYIATCRDASGQIKIESLFSTDPYDYLNPQYQPGTSWTE